MSAAAASDDVARAAELSAALAAAAEQADPAAAAAALRAVALATPGADGPECVRVREAAVAALCDARVAARDGPGLAGILTDLRPLFAVVPKAKTAKLVRGVIDAIAKVPGSEALQVSEVVGRRARVFSFFRFFFACGAPRNDPAGRRPAMQCLRLWHHAAKRVQNPPERGAAVESEGPEAVARPTPFTDGRCADGGQAQRARCHGALFAARLGAPAPLSLLRPLRA
jgi:hypothetical protein